MIFGNNRAHPKHPQDGRSLDFIKGPSTLLFFL